MRTARRTAAVLVAAVTATATGWAVTPATATAAASAVLAAVDGSYRTLATAHNPDWMRALPDATSLAALSIPGTHDTLAIRGGAISQTQEDHGASGRTLRRQLEAGIRMIDIRVRINTGNTFTVHHGAAYQDANFDDVLDTLDAYLGAHPGETVLLRLKHECTGQWGSCTDAAGQRPFRDVFDSYRDNSPAARRILWQPSVRRDAAAAVPTLGQVRGKVVLAVLNGARGGRTDQYGLAQFADWNDGSSTYVQDNYNVPNTGAIATKRDQVRRFLDRTSAGDPARLYVNFASGASLFALPYQVAGGAGGTQGVNPFLLTYLNEGPEVHTPVRRTGAVLLDFPGGALVDRILAHNPR
ncbi:phosphatidylinositol-specific phospholipase C [Spirilliplanes yamanashiensis]|uniref:1-phosphatidylinositol phosphodiesterase n=1 Tax=Spirilliplanes yamanashiensis TaxID=42233 RepID=A0A8J4DKD0_9ACTN|nr:phosphatidylinositol-specific phospholipase C [Spirilliplanes yamanashiensis]MDP9815676.1 1-phosphatidylinositol phosphodiesterase [Spirilliplanes yamanashiensis]GIJ03930.1 1-phosphatidylinositol phosphodiesterase [Spirilliplanes yamanashiensis]